MPAFTQTVRFKLTVWYSSLLLVFGIAFVVSLNLAARLDQPYVVIEGRRYTPDQFFNVPSRPGAAMDFQGVVTLKEAGDSIQAQNLDRLRTWSLISVVGLAIASGVGGYVLSGLLLRPVRDITEVASEIGATNLNRRINHQGPDDELKALADTFDSMIGRLQRSFDQQRLFVQDASHELRTPLAAIRTNIEVTEMDEEVSVEEYRALLDTVKTQTERLARLSDDLLLLTTTEGEHPDVTPTDLHALASEVVAQLAPLAGQRDVTLAVEGDRQLEALAQPDLLYRAVSNLVDNAIKYGGSGAKVTLSVRKAQGQAAIVVSDTGPGIPQEALPSVFDRFYRVDRGRARREGGSGLGLSIVKELVESMNGGVSVESTAGKGASFTIRLPAAPPDAAPGPALAPIRSTAV